MNVFVLCTGRCGSVTFVKACEHITNFTAGHESRIRKVGPGRLEYPFGHIEADNRLAWFLGRLDEAYGDAGFYVHLMRDEEETARSFAKRGNLRLMAGYRSGIYLEPEAEALDVARDLVKTVNANIRLFLKDKTRKMDFRLETAAKDFREFWERIGALGDWEKAVAEWEVHYNQSRFGGEQIARLRAGVRRLVS